MPTKVINTGYGRELTLFKCDDSDFFITVKDTVSRRGIPTYLPPSAVSAIREFFGIASGETTAEPKPTRAPVARLSPQAAQILEHLEKKGSISNVEAQALYKCRALPRRIADLKELGHNIKSEIKTDNTGQRYARYSLAA